MCGITGIFNYGTSSDVEASVLQRMCRVVRHRGPDDEGQFITDNHMAGIAMRRLSIIDVDGGHQPIFNEDKTLAIVLNGEIYNFQELRSRLENRHKFATDHSDTEVIIHLYEEHGEQCVNYLRGMFAFAIWDGKKQSLFLAKDRLGKKPLYYTQHRGAFVFGSEIKSILEYLPTTPAIRRDAIDLFLTYQYIPSPVTIFEGIHSLPPAHTLSCGKNGKLEINKYWDIDFRPKTSLSFQDACEHTKELLMDATKLRMISDVPLGAFLSGGHDSSIIVGLMSQISKTPVKTFCIGFKEEEFSEMPYARIVAKHFGTEHREFILDSDFIDILPKLAWHYGQPFADSSALPSYMVCHETRKHVTVALNGDGGDEAFGGYLRYKAMKASMYFGWPFRLMGQSFSKKIASIIPHVETTKGKNMFRYMSRLVAALGEPPPVRNINWHTFFTSQARNAIYTDDMKASVVSDSYTYLVNIFNNAPANTIMDRTFYTDIKAYLPECLLVKMDIASMANSLEARSPFLDHKVMEFAATLPDNWKVHYLNTKYILKKTFASDLPKEIINRGKMGFGIPVGKWFKSAWSDYFQETVLSEKAIARGYFDRNALKQLFEEHMSGRRDHGYRMWALLMLELWHQQYIDAIGIT